MKGRRYRLVLGLVCLLVFIGGAVPAAADTTAQPLPFSQNWTDISLITVDDNWSGVAGVIGYRGDGLAATGANPQTVTADGSATPVDVNANSTNTNFATGGVTEFHLTNPVVALQGSGTARAPHLVLALDTTGKTGITVAYNVRDIDGGNTDNAVQQVALQYRVGFSGSFTDIPAGYVADATTGPSQATLVTPVSVVLPGAASNQPLVQVRIITADAAGSDEWVGIDDISVGSGAPPTDDAPEVDSTSPSNGASDVPTSSNVEVTFSEPVTTSAAGFSITCTSSGTHTFALSGGPTAYTLNPDSDFAVGEGCTVRVENDGVSDVDTDDPPNNMAADYVFSFTTVGVFARIHDIQGVQHRSTYDEAIVSGVPGVVTARKGNGFYYQDPLPDTDPRTSEAIFVFTGAPTPAVAAVGQAVTVSGRVTEFRPGGDGTANLSTTEIDRATVTPAGPGAAIAQTVVGQGGRRPPTRVIEDDALTGNVETSGVFDPATDGIDFYESLEAMLLRVNNPVVVGPDTGDFGEIWVLADNGSGAGTRTNRGGILVRKLGSAPYPHDYERGDFNPERIQLEDDIVPNATPVVNVRDRFTTAAVGVLDYNFGNFELQLTSALTRVDGGLQREVTRRQRQGELAIATFNVENLSANPLTNPPAKFAALAGLIVNNLRSPDLIAVEEVQDNDGAASPAPTDASLTWRTLIAAIQAAGGPTYDYRQIDPLANQDGGEPDGNIRVGFLFRSDRGLSFVDRPGGTAVNATHENTAVPGAQLTFSPGRVDPTNPAFTNSRKPLAGEFRWRGETFFAVANHFNSKGGDQPLFGRFQPPLRSSETQRHQQAAIVNAFVDELLAADKRAKVVVLGDINDFEFSTTTAILKGGVLTTLVDTLPKPERYTYVFEGNSQVLDQILVTKALLGGGDDDDDDDSGSSGLYDVVHVNAEFAAQDSDHDPSVMRAQFGGDDDDDDDDDD